MFVEIEMREKNYLNELKKLEAEQLAEISCAPLQRDAAKKALLKLIFNITANLQRNTKFTYRVYEPLFDIVKNSRILSLQTHPIWDRFWKKSNTNSMQSALKIVRNAALSVLLNECNRLQNSYNFTAALNLLKGALHKELFTLQRSNWPKLTTNSYNIILEKLEDVERSERHSRGVYTPYTAPLSQYNGWIY